MELIGFRALPKEHRIRVKRLQRTVNSMWNAVLLLKKFLCKEMDSLSEEKAKKLSCKTESYFC